MPSDAWLSFGGQEIINAARTRAYVKELLPTLRMPLDCEDRHVDDNLHRLLADSIYSLPKTDDAPWFDIDDPDSANFCGLLPLSMSGLTDSTRTASVTETTTDGGAVGGQRKGTREVRVTAALIGTDPAAVEAGRTWLKMALDGPCGDPCGKNSLCFLAAIPDADEAMGNYSKGTIQLAQLIGPSGRWSVATGAFQPGAQSRTLDTPPAPEPLPCDEIFWHWTVSALAGTTLIFEAVSETGVLFEQTFTTSGQVETFVFGDKGLADRQVFSRFRVVQDRTVTVSKVEIEYRLPADESTCFEKYMRQHRDVHCVAGPSTIQVLRPSAGAIEVVEFTFVATVPYVYGAERPIITGDDGFIGSHEVGSPVFPLKSTIPLCTAPKTPALVLDPDVPAVPPPPKPQVPASTTPVVEYYEPYAVYIAEDELPLWRDAVPILSLKTGERAARAIRVRFIPRPLPQQAPEDLDPCSACGTFVVDYVPPNATFTLNGMEQRAFLREAGGRETSAGHLLSGPSETELFEWPTLSCGTGYYVVIDVSDSTLAEVALSVATRE